MDEIREFLGELLGVVLLIAIIAALITVMLNYGLAPEPGDPFYFAWLDVTRYGWQTLILVIPGIGAAAYLVLKLVEEVDGS